MHVRDNRAFENLGPVYAAIEQCDAFAAEFHLENSAHGDLGAALYLPEGVTLQSLIGPRRYPRLRRNFLKMAGIDLDMMSDMTPFTLVNVTDQAALAEEQSAALDQHLWDYASVRSRQMHGLETIEEQIQVLQNIPLDYQIKALLDMGRHMPRQRKQVEKLTKLYQEGNIRQLYQSTRKGLGPLRKPMLFERNRIMAQRWHAIASHTTLFAAVGAAHLSGGHGVIRLIKGMGWRVAKG